MDTSADDDIKAQAYLFPAIEKWIDEVSFFAADDDSVSTERLVAWRNIEQVLATLEPHLMNLLLVKQRYLVDILLQHVSPKVYTLNRELWQLCTKCFSHIYSSARLKLWESTDLDNFDVLSFLYDVIEKSLLEAESETSTYKCTIQALAMVAELLEHDKSSSDSIATFHMRISDVIECLQNNLIFQRKLASFLQRYLFDKAVKAREELLDMAHRNIRPPEGKSSLPIRLLDILCVHPCIVKHPRAVIVIVRSHAALCSIPIHQTKPAGILQQHETIHRFLNHLLLCIVDGSFSLHVPKTLREDLVLACVPLLCSDYAPLSDAAKRLVYCIIQVEQNNISEFSDTLAQLTMREVLGDSKSITRFGVSVLEGLRMLAVDQGDSSVLSNNSESRVMCSHTDGLLEVLVDFVVSQTVVSPASVVPTAQKLHEVLTCVSRQDRPKLASHLVLALQRGANCNIKGCSTLLEANVRFLGKIEDSMHTKRPDGDHKRVVVDLTSTAPESQRPAVPAIPKSGADAWSFLKPPTKLAPPAAPLSRLTASSARPSAQGESLLDRMAREEQQQLAQERRDLIRKRIFGDIDSCPPPNSEDLMGRMGKHAKLNSEWDGREASWLTARKPEKEHQEDNWQQQIRELKEAKAKARELAGVKKQISDSAAAVKLGHGGDVGTARDNVHRNKSSLLEKSVSAADEDDGEGSDLEGCDRTDHSHSRRKVLNWRDLLELTKTGNNTTTPASKGPNKFTDVSGLMKLYQDVQSGNLRPGSSLSGKAQPTIAESMAQISTDPLVRKLLKCDLSNLSNAARQGNSRGRVDPEAPNLENVPVRFMQEEHYITSFAPLLLEEVKTAVVACVNGENTSDEARSMDSVGTRDCGRGSSVTLPVRVRCLLRNARAGQPKLQEAHVAVVQNGKGASDRLNKDDLVMIFPSSALPGNLV